MTGVAEWLHTGNVWLIIGLVLALLELASGTMVFLLPMGLGGLFTGLLLKTQEADFLPVLLPDWVWTLVFWAFASLAFSVLLSKLMRKRARRDINDY